MARIARRRSRGRREAVNFGGERQKRAFVAEERLLFLSVKADIADAGLNVALTGTSVITKHLLNLYNVEVFHEGELKQDT